jgi:signal transduction histidine kinase
MSLRLLPRTMYGRLVLLFLAAFVGLQGVVGLFVFQFPMTMRDELLSRDLTGRILPTLNWLRANPSVLSADMSLVLNKMGFELRPKTNRIPQVSRDWENLGKLVAATLRVELLQLDLASNEGNSRSWFVPPFERQNSQISLLIGLDSARDLAYSGQIALGPSVAARQGLLIDVGIRVFGIVVIALLATRWIVNPLRRLTAQAELLGRNLSAAPVSEAGPTEVKQTARAFNQMQSRLKLFLGERSRMLAAVSHDLRTPITRVLLRLEMMPATDARDRSIKDLTQLSEIVNETLEFARGEREASSPETISIASFVRDSVSLDDREKIQIIAGKDGAVLGRRTSLARLLGNLIENALRYGGRATISYALSDAAINIYVDDNGPGIPAEALDYVFEPYYRVESSRNRDSGGKGLGLAIARDIARAHGGDVSLHNRNEGGVRATVTLPLHHPTARTRQERESVVENSDCSERRTV